MPWCRICQTRGHRSEECLYLQNIVITSDSMYCKLCKYIGHDVKDCKDFQLLQEKTMDTYLMNNEYHMKSEQDQSEYPQAQYPQPNIHRFSTCSNNTLNKGGVEILEVEDKGEELVMEEDKLYVIIVENKDIFLGIVRFLRRHVRTTNILITPSNNFCILL